MQSSSTIDWKDCNDSGHLEGAAFDLLFINAAITNGDVVVSDVPTDTFNELMVTNALGPMPCSTSCTTWCRPPEAWR
jgi:hypothetical protein